MIKPIFPIDGQNIPLPANNDSSAAIASRRRIPRWKALGRLSRIPALFPPSSRARYRAVAARGCQGAGPASILAASSRSCSLSRARARDSRARAAGRNNYGDRECSSITAGCVYQTATSTVLQAHTYIYSAPSVNMALDFAATYKVLVLGDSNVGKTCIVHRYCDERYYDTYISTIGEPSGGLVIAAFACIHAGNIEISEGGRECQSLLYRGSTVIVQSVARW